MFVIRVMWKGVFELNVLSGKPDSSSVSQTPQKVLTRLRKCWIIIPGSEDKETG